MAILSVRVTVFRRESRTLVQRINSYSQTFSRSLRKFHRRDRKFSLQKHTILWLRKYPENIHYYYGQWKIEHSKYWSLIIKTRNCVICVDVEKHIRGIGEIHIFKQRNQTNDLDYVISMKWKENFQQIPLLRIVLYNNNEAISILLSRFALKYFIAKYN